MRYRAIGNLSYFVPAIIIVGLLLWCALLFAVGWFVNRRGEARRDVVKYNPDRCGNMHAVPVVAVHSLCLWWICFQPERGPCSRH